MPEITALTKQQHLAVALLADGLSQTATAKRLGVTREAVNRWCNQVPEFGIELQQEIARREARTKEQYQKAADEIQDLTIKQFKEDVMEFQNSLRAAHRTRIARGLKLMQKAGHRFDDLPEEAIKPGDISGLIMAADRLLEKGFEGWAESLAISELLQRLENGEI